MEVKIKKIDDMVVVKFAKEALEVSERSQDWNNDGIFKFLTKLAASVDGDEKIEIIRENEVDPEPKEKIDVVYNHICKLFKSFADEYNS